MTTANTFATAATKTAGIRRTTNGMKTLDTSLNACVDLFFNIGSSRGKDISASFERAYQEDRVLALRIAAWARDVRGGAGERQVFRDVLKFVEKNHINELPMFINAGPSFGRWDDILVLETETGKKLAFDLIKDTLFKGVRAQSMLLQVDSMSEEEAQKILDSANGLPVTDQEKYEHKINLSRIARDRGIISSADRLEQEADKFEVK